MKKTCSIILVFILMISIFSTALAAGYTLPEKMERQLQVGSGLKGSFVVYANADSELSPLVHSVQNAEFEIRGIQYEGNKHYYIYQAGDSETMKSLTEYCTNDDNEYLRSDFLEEGCYQLPTLDHLINAWLKSEGENPSVFPDLLRMILDNEKSGEMSTEGLERQIEVWISAFSTESTVQSGDGMPTLSQTFKIPVNELYNSVTDLIRTVTSDEAYMGYFREILTKEQIDTYLNPDFGYYYVDAMQQLDMEGDILFTRTVSTLGELIQSSLVLPMDPGKTGYSSATFENNETRKSFCFSGPRGVLYLDLPSDFDLKEDETKDAEVHFALIDNENEKSKNVALKILFSKKAEKSEDTEDNRIHEKETYTLQMSRDTEGLPETITDDLIPDMAAAEAEIVIHYSSKPQLSSPTTLEFSCKVSQGRFRFDLEGKVKTSSPWVYAPFDVSNAKNIENYEIRDFDNLKETWIRNAEEKTERIPEEIRNNEESSSEDTAEIPEDPASPDGDDEANGEAEPIEVNENETEDSDPIG